MSYNGSGTFVINTAGQPVVSGTVISSTAFNALTADLATGLSTAITKDGQTTPTANIPMGNNKITGLAAGTAATDAANLSQVQSTAAKLINSISGADTITGTLSPTLTAYAAGQMFYFVAAGDNTGAVTLNINSLGAKSVTRDGTTALIAGDIKNGEVCVVVYDGTQFQLVNAANSFSGNVTAAKFIPTGNVTAGNGMYLPTTNTLAFSTDGSERLRIDASGNAGLGVTPSAWGSSYRGLQVGYGGAIFAGNNTFPAFVGISANKFINNTPADIYLQNGAATEYYQNAGQHIWRTAPSGTAGNAISFTQALTLNSNGNLALQGGTTTASGVGVTFPASQSASSDANCLDDYEEGTFDPIIASGITSPTYSSRAGRYTKIGRFVFVTIGVTVNGGTRNSNQLQVGGLPFNIGTTGAGTAFCIAYSADVVASTTTNQPFMYGDAGATTVTAYKTDGGGFFGTDCVSANIRFDITGSYYID